MRRRLPAQIRFRSFQGLTKRVVINMKGNEMRSMIRTAFIVFLFSASLSFAATRGKIEGFVKDALTGDALPGANVMLEGTSLGAASDLKGKYFITNVPPGDYFLIVRYIGYKERRIPIRIKAGRTLQQDIELQFMVVKGKELVVTAQAEGQMSAINQQLAARSIVNVVSSARIQELPDANAAESVGRLPGVSIKRSGGEGNKVVIRGLSPKYNSITVNGVKLASTGSGDRSTDISMISPFMLQGIEVIKAITPDQDADVLGGTVNFRFRKAPRGKKGLRLDGIAQGGYNGLTDTFGDRKFVFSASNRFFDNKLGLFAQADIERRNRSADQLNVNYDIINPSLKEWNRVVAQSATFQKVGRIKNRYGAALVLDYQLKNGSIIFSNFGNKSGTDVKTQRETFSSATNTHSYAINDNSNDLTLVTNALNFEYDFNRFRVDAVVANSFAENKAPLNLSYNFQELSAFTNATGLENPFSIVDSAKNNIENTYINLLSANERYTKENQFTVAANMEISLNISKKISSKIKFGAKYRHQYKFNDVEAYSRSFQAYRYSMDSVRVHFPWMNQVDVGSAVIEKLPYQLFIDPDTDTRKFLDGKFVFGPSPRYDLLQDLYRMLKTTPDNIRKGLNGAPLLWKHWPNSIRSDYDGTEDYSAAYLMAEFNIGSDWMILPGARFERNTTTYTASRGDDARRSEEGYNYQDTTLTRVNEFLLPMLHVKYKATSWMDFRFAYTNTLTRPNYNRIVPFWHLNTTSGRLAYNNYKLKPGHATNYDFFVSVYQNYIGFFSTGLFYKKIRDLVYNPGELVITDPAVWDLPKNLSAETISTSINNKYEAKIWGIELDWQTYFWYLPKPLNGVVLNINYTHMGSETKYPRNEMREIIVGYDTTYVFGQQRVLPIWETVNVDTFYTARVVNQPNDIVNVSLGYDFKGFSARVSMLYTDDILTGTNFWEELRSATDKHVRWDLAVKQKLPIKGMQVYFNLNNFTNAVDRSLIAGNPYPAREEYYDLTMDLGLRYRF